MIILKTFSLLLWLLLIPFCMGLLVMPLLKREQRTPGVVLIAGYILQFALVEIVGIPVVIYAVYNGYSTFLKCFLPLTVLLAVLGALLAFRGRKRGMEWDFPDSPGEGFKRFWTLGMEEKVLLALFLLLVLFQMYMAFTRASFDGDDAYYGVQAVIAQQVDTLYRVNPYTGRSAPLDVRHALALFPIWEACIGSVSGIHATVVCHSILPLVLIPLTYLIYYQIGRALFRKKRELLPMFLVLIALWQVFGNISIYTTETFFLTRTWQGKSFAGNVVIPAVIWIFLLLYEDSKEAGLWLLLGALNLAGGASSSLAVLLSCLMTAGFGFLYAAGKRSFGILVRSGLACVSGGIYVLLYLMLTHGMLGV
ncbi:MAG: DUF6077 domain-containing protein [Lachnospiraceae bacterium]|nr:DUF6077 domain-containing protein [Lachnospiraceae bacterium]